MTFASTAIVLFATVTVSPPSAAELTSAQDVLGFLDRNTPGEAPFAITGCVQSVQSRYLIVKDRTGRLLINHGNTINLTAGDVVRICGMAFVNQELEYYSEARETLPLGCAPIDPPEDIALSDLNEGRDHLKRVRTTATCIDITRDQIDPSCLHILLQDEGTVLPAVMDMDDDSRRTRLIGARLRLTGIYKRYASGSRKFTSPQLACASWSDIEILSPAPTDPFEAPKLNNRPYQTPRHVFGMGRRKIEGTVLAAWEPGGLMIGTDIGQTVLAELVGEQTPPPVDSRVTVAGYPETDTYALKLVRAQCRVDGPGVRPPDAPRQLTIEDLQLVWNGVSRLGVVNSGILVQIKGSVSRLTTSGGTRIARLGSGVSDTSVDYTCTPSAFDSIPVGSTVTVTGFIRLDGGRWHPFAPFPRIAEALLVPRDAHDVVLISGPSWWTPKRLLLGALAVLLLLTAFLAKTLLSQAFMKTRLRERTNLAVELHDSLSQTLTAVSCQIIAAEDTFASNPEQSEKRLQTAGRILTSCRKELKNCLFDLRSEMTGRLDLASSLERTLKPFEIDATIRMRILTRRLRLDETMTHDLLSIVRELVSNAVRHGSAASIYIAACVDGGNLLVSVRDDGCGFDVDSVQGPNQGHFGLTGIRDRLAHLSGTLRIKSTPEHGTHVRLALPLNRRSRTQ